MVNKLQIVRVDDLTVQKVDLQIGDNIIGRGAATGSPDNPIAEHAVIINLDANGSMTITPMLACYMKNANSCNWRLLKIGSTVPISPGDICSLLPDKSWFKITCLNSSTKMEDDTVKRKSNNSSEEEPPDKKVRLSNSVETVYSQSKSFVDNCDTESELILQDSKDCVPPSMNNNSQGGNLGVENPKEESTLNNPDNEIPSEENVVTEDNLLSRPNPLTPERDLISNDNQSENRDDAGKKIKWDCGQHFSDQTEHESNETSAEATSEEPTAGQDNSTAEATIAQDEPPRNKCAYGSQCYRRNSDHRSVFSHPGDPDYDIPDTRPECPYGIRCYRKNPQHKRDFKHTRNRPSRAQTPVRGRGSDVTSGTEQSSAEESVDESDYEPSYYGETSEEYRSDLDAFSDFEGVSDDGDDK